MKSIYNFKLVSQTIPPDPEPGDEKWRTVFDHAYLGNKVLNNSGQQASSGEEVNVFVDQIGSLNMPWVTVPEPPPHPPYLLLSKAKPRYYNQSGGFVFLPNETDLRYRTSQISSSYPDISERWFVGIDANYKIFEAYFKDREYIGDRGVGGGLRTRNGSAFPGDESHLTSLDTPVNGIFIVRQKFRNVRPNIPQANGQDVSFLMETELWVGGVKEPKIMSTLRFYDYSLGLGADTNNSHWGLIAMFFKASAVSDSDANEVTQELMAQYKVGQPLNLPIATNIAVNKTGSTFTASYVFSGVDGVQEDVSARKIKWILVYGGISYAEYIPGTDNLMSFNAANYPLTTILNGQQITTIATDPDRGLRVEITVQDTQGRKHVIPQTILISSSN